MRRLDETIRVTGARRVVSVVNAHLMPQTPAGIAPERHLKLPLSEQPPGRGAPNPALALVEEMIAFARAWSRTEPLVVHCFSGLNRSPAAAYIIAAALNPSVPETLIAYRLRAASETAAPNLSLVGAGDLVLARSGKLMSAVRLIGPGHPAAEAEPFALSTDFSG